MSEGSQNQINFCLLNSDNSLPNSKIKLSNSVKIDLNDSKMNKNTAQIIKPKNSLNFNIFANMNKAQMENDSKNQNYDLRKEISKDSINNNNNNNTVNVNNNINENNNNINNNAIYTNESKSSNSKNNNNNNNPNSQNDTDVNTQIVIQNYLQINENYLKDDPTIEKTRLSDLGKKSYLNSVLQCLVNIDDLSRYFLDEKVIKNIYSCVKDYCLSFSIQRLFYHSKFNKDKNYSPDSIANVLAKKNIIFQQNDTEINPKYCINFILEQLHYELNKNKGNNNNLMLYNQYNQQDVINFGKKNFEQQNNSIISYIFAWYGLKEYCCSKCSNKKFQFQTFYTFELDNIQLYNLPQKNKIGIYDCLNYSCYFSKTSKTFCEICRCYCSTNNFLRIINSPKVLIFIIDRGNFENNFLNLNFIINNEINLAPYMHTKKNDIKYELNSIISVFENKFISLIKADEDYWYLFNDSKVIKVENCNLINMQSGTGVKHIPYILFYKLKN